MGGMRGFQVRQSRVWVSVIYRLSDLRQVSVLLYQRGPTVQDSKD